MGRLIQTIIIGIAFLSTSWVGRAEEREVLWEAEHLSPVPPVSYTKVKHLMERLLLLQPMLEPSRAETLARLLVRWSPKPELSAAILMQESGLRDIHANSDLGVAQINRSSARYYLCDEQRLEAHDLREAIRCHSAILREKIRECETLKVNRIDIPDWTCYHSKTPSRRVKYFKAVRRYLNPRKEVK